MVRVNNREGIPNIGMKSVHIEILPPPWRTWWAYTIYGILFLAGIFGLLWMQAERSRSIERARAAERDQFRKKLARDFHDEAGNKITLLSLLTDRARKKSEGNAEVEHLLLEQQEYIQQLRNGMRDFIWIMDPSKDKLFDTVVRFRDFAEKACEQADVTFTEKGRTETLRDSVMPGNVRRHFILIFKEALNNSLKYANAGNISFTVRKNAAQHWEFELRDDGIGFDMHRVSQQGNGLDNMRSRATQINSVLDIRTAKDSGTSVILTWKP
jgi:signal transduction histidine kinase